MPERGVQTQLDDVHDKGAASAEPTLNPFGPTQNGIAYNYSNRPEPRLALNLANPSQSDLIHLDLTHLDLPTEWCHQCVTIELQCN